MSVTSGFFNSLNHDRRYNAQQMSSIFDGVINDGVFANIGVAFRATAAGGVTVDIGEGKAWFNSAWVHNDTVLPLTFEASEVVLDRIDAIIIDVDHNESVRSGDIKIVKGTPSSSPKRPTMVSDKKHKQAPLVYIYRKAGSTEITQADITNMVGTSECPYITGILQVQNIDNIVAQWNAQWNQWYAEKTAETNSDASELLAEMKSEFDIWFAYVQALMSEKIVEADSGTSELLAKMRSEFDSWFDDFKTVLDDDAATSLAAKVADLMAKFDTLAKEGAVYDEIEDSNLDEILGSDGTPIQGKTVIGSGTGGSVDLSEPMSGDIDMNSYRVIHVADPEQDDDAANAGYVKMVAAEVASAASKASTPRNLLDNSDFRNPVNQRGFVSGTGGTANYTIDRWKLQYSTYMGLEEDSISLWGHWCLWQPINQKFKVGKKYTLAVECKGENGNERLELQVQSVISGAQFQHVENNIGTEWKTIAAVFTPYQDLPIGDCSFDITLQSPDGQPTKTFIRWAALYEGEYTIDTLPQYQPKGYENELLVCRQYDPSTGEYIGLRKFGYAHNLLDNSDFRNPVASEGFKTNPGGNGNPIDRWYDRYGFGVFTQTDNGITIAYGTNHAYFNQTIKNADKLIGKTLTLAACKYDGTISVCSGVFTGSGMSLAVIIEPSNVLSIDNDYVQFCVVEGSVGLRWAALYEGEYTIDTLPEYQPKGYKVEALNCGALNYDIPVTITAQSWAFEAGSGMYYSIRDGLAITEEDDPIIDISLSTVYDLATVSVIIDAWGEIIKITTWNGYIVLYSASKPSVDIPIKIKVVR